MRAQEERLARPRPKLGDDVANPRTGDEARPLEIVADDLVANDRVEAYPSQLADQPRADEIVAFGVAACGLWSPRTAASRAFARPASNSPGALSREAAARKSAPTWRPCGKHEKDESQSNDCAAPHGLPPCSPPCVLRLSQLRDGADIGCPPVRQHQHDHYARQREPGEDEEGGRAVAAIGRAYPANDVGAELPPEIADRVDPGNAAAAAVPLKIERWHRPERHHPAAVANRDERQRDQRQNGE